MTTVQLYYRHEFKSLRFTVASFDVGIELLQYFVNDLLCDGTVGFAVAIESSTDAESPILHFQQCQGACFLQIYASDAIAVDGEEGWHCLVESDGVRKAKVEELVKVAANDSKEYLPVRFAEGVLFSSRLLVSTDTVKAVLSQFTGQSTIREWLRQGKWINLGLL